MILYYDFSSWVTWSELDVIDVCLAQMAACMCVTMCAWEALCFTVWCRGCVSPTKSHSGQCHSSASGSKYPWEPSPMMRKPPQLNPHMYTHPKRPCTKCHSDKNKITSAQKHDNLGFIMPNLTRRSIRGGPNLTSSAIKTSHRQHRASDVEVTTLTPNQRALRSDPKPTLRTQLAVTAAFVVVPLGYTAQL